MGDCTDTHPTTHAPAHPPRFYATLRRKAQPGGLLEGVAFTGFGLGDSNYTRYMYVPRAVKQRFLDLGAQPVSADLCVGMGAAQVLLDGCVAGWVLLWLLRLLGCWWAAAGWRSPGLQAAPPCPQLPPPLRTPNPALLLCVLRASCSSIHLGRQTRWME